MHGKYGKGQKTTCIVCQKSFTKQGNRRTCGNVCRDRRREERTKLRVQREIERFSQSKRKFDRRKLQNRIYVNSGYVVMTGPDARAHPAVAKNGWVRVHVMAAYDKYGPGPHSCHWCGKAINWYFGQRTGENGTQKIIVDHLNWVTIDCRSENLVLSCGFCNWTRGRDGLDHEERSRKTGINSKNIAVRCTGCNRDWTSFQSYRGHRKKCKSGKLMLL